jgi:hypothetical protein
MADEGGDETGGFGSSACGSSECSSIRGASMPNPKNQSFSMRSPRQRTIPLNAKEQKYCNQFGDSFKPELYSGYAPAQSSGNTSPRTASWDITPDTPPSWDRTRRTASPGNSTPYTDMFTAPTSTIYDENDIYWPTTTRSGIDPGATGVAYRGLPSPLPAGGVPTGPSSECPATFGLGAGAANTMNQCPAAANFVATYKGCGPCSPCGIAAKNAAPAVGGGTFVRGGAAVPGGGATLVRGGTVVADGGATFAGGCGGNCSDFTQPSFNLADNLMSSRLSNPPQFDSTIGPPLGQSTPVHVSRVDRTTVTQSPASPCPAKAASLSSANPTQASFNIPSMHQSTLTASPASAGQNFSGSMLTVSPGQNSSSRGKDELSSQVMELTDYLSTRESLSIEEGVRMFQKRRREDLNATM